jgi:ABC-type transport system involved in multi-copper enzyme maturation permease subunit
MLTGTLALLHRALRLDSRLISAHLFRFGFAVLMYFSLIIAHLQSYGLAGAPGLRLFESMMTLNVLLIILAGISFFATAITEEKEEETLGLLKMAGLNPLGLLLGKSTSRLINTLLLLGVQFPFTLLAVTLGGATVTQIVAGYAALAAFLVLTANVGLLASVAFRRGGTASWVVSLFFLIYFLARPLLDGLTKSQWIAAPPGSRADQIIQAVGLGSVWTRLQEIFSTGFAGPTLGLQFWSNCGLALVSFLVAWGSFNYFTNPRRMGAATPDLADRLQRLFGSKRPRPRSHPVMWKEYQFVTGGSRFLIARFCCYLLFVILGVLAGLFWGQASSDETAQVISVIVLGLVIVEACFYASRLLHDEWREHTLPMLLMLPIPVHRILLTKLAGCVPALIPGLSCLVISLCFWEGGLEYLWNTLFLPSYWMFVIVFVLMLTLTMFFSLVVRWGALPLAIAVMLFSSTFAGCCFVPAFTTVMGTSGGSIVGREAACAVIDAILILLILALQFDIQRRLEIASAQ